MKDDHHRTEVQRTRGRNGGFRAYCTTRDCGWVSPTLRNTEQAAIDDGTDHEVAAVR